MNRSFTGLALSIALTLMMVQFIFNDPSSGRELPLLTTLFINEVGAFIALFGFMNGLKKTKEGKGATLLTIGMAICLLLAVIFFWNGYQYWPTLSS